MIDNKIEMLEKMSGLCGCNENKEIVSKSYKNDEEAQTQVC